MYKRQPDAIFLDINMPKINGWEFLDAYKKINITKSPIVIMLTTSISPEDQQKAAMNPLVSSFKSKPLNESHLKELQHELKGIC